MSFFIDIQNELPTIPFSTDHLQRWAQLALETNVQDAELTIRLIKSDEMCHLNNQYRHKNNPTNVLSFPSELPKEILAQLEVPFIGDIIICPEVLLQESIDQNKDLEFHWAHIVIHGVLHLLGYDHIDETDAKTMQTLEIQILEKFHFPNPYEQNDNENIA
jgi:probable rRNA maturation factor